jgi:hypothetical protein
MTETDLRWRLRQLPRDIEPTSDLWPGILAGIERRPLRNKRPWTMGLAMAASVLLAAGLFWKTNGGSNEPAGNPDPTATIVSNESRAVTDEYQAALRQFDGAPIAEQMSPSLSALDRSVAQIQSAIVADPHSVFLLQQLRKTYSRRLALTQRAVTS